MFGLKFFLKRLPLQLVIYAVMSIIPLCIFGTVFDKYIALANEYGSGWPGVLSAGALIAGWGASIFAWGCWVNPHLIVGDDTKGKHYGIIPLIKYSIAANAREKRRIVNVRLDYVRKSREEVM